MNNKFLVKDLYVASYIYAKHAPFQGIERQGKICWFIFNNKVLCEQLQQEFFAKTGQVVGKDYSDSLRTLKDLVFTNY